MATRRDVLKLALAGLLLPRTAMAGGESRLAGCRFDAVGGHFLSVVDADAGSADWDLALPGRGHAVAPRPGSREIVVFARRPGTYMVVADVASGTLKARIDSVSGRHFFGHGVFSQSGRWLFATENDFDAARGVIGVYDAAHGYRRVAEFDSGGVGPHQVGLSPDGRILVVANGGIRTHPDFGRSKLNLDSMRPSLALVDSSTGALVSCAEPPAALHQLSIRHVATDRAGRICVAMQFQGPKNQYPPLVAFSDGQRLDLYDAPDGIQERMHNYCGSVAFVSKAGLFAVSSPHEGLVTLWSAESGFVDAFEVPRESSAICTSGSGDSVWSVGGEGRFRSTTLPTRAGIRTGFELTGYHWDNHATLLPPGSPVS